MKGRRGRRTALFSGLAVLLVASLAVWDYLERTGVLELRPATALLVDNGVKSSRYIALLKESGFDVERLDDKLKLGSVKDLGNYGVVLVLGGSNWQTDMPRDAQKKLVDYVKGGGGLFVDEWMLWQTSQGHYVSLKEVFPQSFVSWSSGVDACKVRKPRHPIARGLPRSFSLSSSHGYTRGKPKSSSDVVITGSLSGSLLTVREVGKGRVAELSIVLDGSDVTVDKNLARVFINAVKWAAGKG